MGTQLLVGAVVPPLPQEVQVVVGQNRVAHDDRSDAAGPAERVGRGGLADVSRTVFYRWRNRLHRSAGLGG